NNNIYLITHYNFNMVEDENLENGAFSAADFTFCQKYSLFNKPIFIQYFILGLWIISSVMGLYYILYDASYDYFVRAGILPFNLEWMGIVISIFIFIGFGLLLYPVDPLKYEKLRLEQQLDQEIVQIETILEEAHFSRAISQLESLLITLNEHHNRTDRAPLLKLLQKAELNHSVGIKIKDLHDSFDKISSSQRIVRYKDIQAVFQENHTIIHESVSDQYLSLSLKLTGKSPNPDL
ncbi:MAG: hypothetical protein KAR20_13945, partial [Candidatus Heimdallarchaeota archaeon]|nr:hypothetical protein [Candidatus Heimdallarchaeota archaeon]